MNEETWKPIVGFETLYEVSDQGRVRTLDLQGFNRPSTGKPRTRKAKVINGWTHNTGYTRVYLGHGIFGGTRGKCHYVHRLVASAFIPNPDNKPQINHKNGIRTDNRVENIEWCTNSENGLHAFRVLGRIAKGTPGERNYFCKLSEEDIRHIRIRAECGVLWDVLAADYGVSTDMISRIVKRKNWQHVA